MSYEDKHVVCVECGAEFVFGAQEQKEFASKGFVNGPKRCKPCREARKAAHGNRSGGNTVQPAAQSHSYGNRGGGGGGGGYGSASGGRQHGRGSYSARSSGGGRSFNNGPRQLFPATCASCGQQTEVPFKPSGARPVYCRDCFQSQKAAGGH